LGLLRHAISYDVLSLIVEPPVISLQLLNLLLISCCGYFIVDTSVVTSA